MQISRVVRVTAVGTTLVVLGAAAGAGVAAWAGDRPSARVTAISTVYYCRGEHGEMRQVSPAASCAAGERKYVLSAKAGPRGASGPAGATGPRGAVGPRGGMGRPGVAGPRGPRGVPGAVGRQGPPGATGAKGARGDTGPIGPSDVYVSSLQSTTVTDSQTTVAAVTVPGDGDYALAFSAVFLNPDSTGTVVACGMEVDTTGTKEVIATPATADTLVDEFSNVTASAVGVVRLSDAESATLTMACQLDPGANSNTVTAGWVHFMATRVGTVTDESPI